MQDRFKFRVWLKNENRYGYLLNLFNCGSNSQYEVEEYDEQGNHYTVYSADEVILQQCTGLRDKNDKLIYEGDIIINPDDSERYAIIEWDNNECRHIINVQTENWCCDFSNYWSKELEVVGNIYENPELLEGSNANI